MKINRVRIVIILCIHVFLASCQMNGSTKETSAAQVLPDMSLQLWSVNDALKQDYKGTLRKISAMGFKNIEFARNFGPYNNEPRALKRYLDEIGLNAHSAHIHMGLLSPKRFESTVKFYQDLGVNTLIIAGDNRADDPVKITKLVVDLNSMHKKLQKHGIQFGYHNHPKEFESFGDSTYWDYIAQNTPNSFIMQLDVGHATTAGKDPAEYIKRYPNRTILTHLKPKRLDNKDMENVIGQDSIDWPSVLTACINYGGTIVWIIEHDKAPKTVDTLKAVAQSKKNLEQIINTL